MTGANTGELIFGVSDFVAVINQTFEYAYHDVAVQGEISNYRVSKGKWVHFDIKDEFASMRCFATIYQLHGIFEDGMMVKARVMPQLHPQYGFSLTISQIQPVGEGAIKRASDLLRRKLDLEGLFAPERKRLLPDMPQHIALVASSESAAYGDFIKVLNSRWVGVTVDVCETQVQGEAAPEQIAKAINRAAQTNAQAIIITRGGGSKDDLAAFDDERVVRAVAASRLPTLVAIGHERDESLAELAADKRASTPSNAAELLTPDKTELALSLKSSRRQLDSALIQLVSARTEHLKYQQKTLNESIKRLQTNWQDLVKARKQLVELLDPLLALKRGFAVVHDSSGKLVRSSSVIQNGQSLTISFAASKVDVVAQKTYSDNKTKE